MMGGLDACCTSSVKNSSQRQNTSLFLADDITATTTCAVWDVGETERATLRHVAPENTSQTVDADSAQIILVVGPLHCSPCSESCLVG